MSVAGAVNGAPTPGARTHGTKATRVDDTTNDRRRSVRAVQASLPGIVLVGLAAALWGTDGLFRRGLALELPAA